MTGHESSEWTRKTRILFVCEGNTCRSVMAEYIARARYGGTFEPGSAGFKPQIAEDAENAIYTLTTMKIDASGHRPRDIRQLDVGTFDVVVAMDKDRATKFRACFPSFPAERLMTWDIRDPYGDDQDEYDECARKIQHKIAELSSHVGGTS